MRGIAFWRLLASLMLSSAAVLLALGGLASPAHAAFGVTAFDGSVLANQSGDVSYTQAGGHPYAVSTTISLNTRTDPVEGPLWPDEPMKDVLVDVPPGLIGNPTAVAQCSLDELANGSGSGELCPAASQVGLAAITLPICPLPGFCVPASAQTQLFSMVPPPDVPARFGFVFAGTVVTLDAELRSGTDYGLSVNARNVSEGLAVTATSLTLWGIPADPIHTPERACPASSGGLGCAAGVPPKAFLRLPTSCNGPQTTTLNIDSWMHPGTFATASFTSHQTAAEGGALVGASGCNQVPFTPTLDARPMSTASPGPSGWTFDLRIPQETITDPSLPAQSDLKKAVVTLPRGVRVSPSSADGLGACSAAQIDIHSSSDPTCPDASKVGTVTVDTPLLDDPLTGAIYLATPHANPTNSLIGLYLVAKGPGLMLKLPGKTVLDPKTGQISATFDNNPQLPFSHLHLEFFGGSRAALSNPPHCGTYTTKATLTGWSGKVVESESSFTTSHDGHGAPCPATQFKPTFSAGTQTANGDVPAGGSSSSFVLNVVRSDDDEELASIKSVDLPNGLLAKIANVPLCSTTNVALGTCSEGSRIGTVSTAAGPGLDPFVVKGRVYLGTHYHGAPFSLSIVIPAIAGPFDLGTIVVRAALDIDPTTAKASVRTDPLPTILDGIPLQVRWISVLIDRPKFMVNPTSCNPKTIGATVVSTAGTVAKLRSRFKVNDCASLPLSPTMRMSVGSKGHTRRHVSTPLTTTLTQPPGQTGLKAVSVTLPTTLNARLDVVNNACTQVAFDAGHCASARAGSAVAITPLLKRPLKGGAFFVQDPDKPAGSLPNLVIALRGQVKFNLVGTIEVPQGKLLATTFATVPDVPITRFTLRLNAGKQGPLGTVADLCTARSKRQVATLSFRGQNGKLVRVNQPLHVMGCAKRSGR
ncbi:MAG TPA: hypothetical protein VE972_10310 [Conexibacter sp.]|nr:hypothetical protein [Conexibacter sp.]